jgi:hypothetical protein
MGDVGEVGSVVVVSLVALAACASFALGCAAGTSDETAAAQPGPVVAYSATGHAALPPEPRTDAPRIALHAVERELAARTAAIASSACKKGAFCDDFEDAAPGTRWSGTVASAGVVELGSASTTLGAHSLRTSTSGAGGLAYLTVDAAVVGSHWAGALGFSMRVDAAPSASLGGPAITVALGSGASVRIGFSVTAEAISLHQYAGDCGDAPCDVRTDRVTSMKPGEWRRLVVAVEAASSLAPPYGRVEVTVDGGELITLPLVVPAFAGPASVQAGITAADDAPATVSIDDVVFETH